MAQGDAPFGSPALDTLCHGRVNHSPAVRPMPQESSLWSWGNGVIL